MDRDPRNIEREYAWGKELDKVFRPLLMPILDDPDLSIMGQTGQMQRFDELLRRYDPNERAGEPHPYIDYMFYESDDEVAAAQGTRYFTPLMRACFRKKELLAYHIYARSTHLDRIIPDIHKTTSIRKICYEFIQPRCRMAALVEELHEAIMARNGRGVAGLLAAHPYLINIPYGSGFTPLIAVCWARNMTGDPAALREYNEIARFLLSQPALDIVRYRAGSKSNKACYYCIDMEPDVIAAVRAQDRSCRENPYPPVEEEANAPVAVAPVAAAAPGPRGIVLGPSPIPVRGPDVAAAVAAAAAAAAAANGSRESSNSIFNWENAAAMLTEGRGRGHSRGGTRQQRSRRRKTRNRRSTSYKSTR